MFVRLAFFNASRGKSSLWSKSIAWWTRPGPYSHVELWLANDAENALCFSAVEGTGTRFTTRSLVGGFDVVSLSEDARRSMEVRKQCAAIGRTSYDWLGLLGFLGPIKVHDGDDRFCSEVCYEVLDKAGLIKDPEQRWKVSPNDLAHKVTSIYGQLKPV